MQAHNIHIFLGPTLSQSKARAFANARFRPPAAMGDITHAVATGAEAIVLVDGVFERGPSVWHKEIMWALSCGIPVIGASSMGALRAAELDQYGMLGFGEVYNGYARGTVTDDDEVAVVHGPEELQWLCLTDAMVDIRYRIKQAQTAGIISCDMASLVVENCKQRFFKDRNLKTAIMETISNRADAQAVHTWLVENTIGIKQKDCEFLLRALPAVIASAQQLIGEPPQFEPTVYLRRLEKFGFNMQSQR